MKTAKKTVQAVTLLAPAKKPHTTWKGAIQVGLITFPINLHTGARAERIAFKSLHDKCLGTLKMQDMKCPTCEEVVPKESILKGYEYEKDQFVCVTQDELAEMKPATDRLMEVDTFVKADELDPIYLETSYYLTPGDGGLRAYHLIRRALVATGKIAIGKATISSTGEAVIAIRPYGDGLILHTLYYPDEVKAMAFPADQLQSGDAELNLAKQLIDSMSNAFDPSDWVDEYVTNVKALIRSKLNKGEKPVIKRAPATATAPDLMSMLSASVKAVKTAKKAKVA